MSQYLLIERIQVQNANAVAGFTWGFPSITSFLGFSHNLNIKLNKATQFNGLMLNGCIVVAHNTTTHVFEVENGLLFSQQRGTNYLDTTKPADAPSIPPVIEEAKMNMKVSLLIPIDGYIGGAYEQNQLIEFIKKCCLTQRLAGGTILNINAIELVDLSQKENLKFIKNKLLPGFVLQDRSAYLKEHLLKLKESNSNVELLDAWFDFITLKQAARPVCDLIDKYFASQANNSEFFMQLNEIWLNHKEHPYNAKNIPIELTDFFSNNVENLPKNIVNQWEDYLAPTDKTTAEWEYIRKPNTGFLVPIMTGYKAITKVFTAGEIEGARDIETDIAFVEAVHSVGEWQSVHRLKESENWYGSVWNYTYEKGGWYLCKQDTVKAEQSLTYYDPYQ